MKNSKLNINDLPEEVLILILQNLSWRKLLQVKGVCKRWKRLASDRSAWTETCFGYDELRLHTGDGMFVEKFLCIAPVVGKLELVWGVLNDSVLRVLLRTRTPIRRLTLDVGVTFPPQDHSLVAPLLRHLAPNLECLILEVGRSMEWSIEELILGSMPKLRSLRLSGNVFIKEDLNRLMPDSPVLEKLRIRDLRQFEKGHNEFDNCKIIIRNNETLKLLHFNDRVELSSVKECRYLTDVSLPLECLQVVSHLPLIEKLCINCREGAKPPQSWISPKNLKELILCFEQDPLPSAAMRYLRGFNAPSLDVYGTHWRQSEDKYNLDIKSMNLHCHLFSYSELRDTLLRNRDIFLDVHYLNIYNSFPRCDFNKDDLDAVLPDLVKIFPNAISIRHTFSCTSQFTKNKFWHTPQYIKNFVKRWRKWKVKKPIIRVEQEKRNDGGGSVFLQKGLTYTVQL